ncbi:transketolase [Kitasatospora fiedleri]|uniref:transketolase n=1 Tax=Kitasatospora fiedleri TaxID=2991545 RepID=UPI00249AFCD0|nr:transketolase [Kitasatospora fiedleri]
MTSTRAAAGPVRAPAELALGARRRILRFAGNQQVHLGSSLSVVDLLIAVLRETGAPAGDPSDPGRPRLVLSKGHAVWALYAVLAEHGLLDTERPGPWAGHPVDGVPGVDAATGALGHGLSIGAGLAEAARLQGRGHRTHVVLGDGELNEGSVWEAAMFAAHRRLDRLVALVDVNGMQQEGTTAEVLDLGPLDRKWRAFGWRTVTVDGHDHAALRAALTETAAPDGQPTVLLAHTVKGKGVPFMEHSADWHTGTLDPARLAAALAALDRGRAVADD